MAGSTGVPCDHAGGVRRLVELGERPAVTSVEQSELARLLEHGAVGGRHAPEQAGSRITLFAALDEL